MSNADFSSPIFQVYGPDWPHWLDEPHYGLLCDMHYTEILEDELQYVAQSELRLAPAATERKLTTMYANHYFYEFEEELGRYEMRPWLRKVYPKDDDELD